MNYIWWCIGVGAFLVGFIAGMMMCRTMAKKADEDWIDEDS